MIQTASEKKRIDSTRMWLMITKSLVGYNQSLEKKPLLWVSGALISTWESNSILLLL